MEVKEKEHFWVITHDSDNMQHLYDKQQFTEEQAIFNELFQDKIMSALHYTLTQVKDITTKHLIAQEFWHSLNRKGLIPNGTVQTLISWTTE
jgi:hypothetical protein